MLLLTVSLGSLTEFPNWSRPRAAGPFAGLVAAVWLLWGHGVGFADVGLSVFFYLRIGLANRGLDELPGRGERLRRCTPPSSRLHRQARRSALSVPVRHRAGPPATRRPARPRRLAARQQPDVAS
jgi:hypothetical protein